MALGDDAITGPTRTVDPDQTVTESGSFRLPGHLSAAALREDALARNRALTRNLLLLLCGGALLLPFLGGDPVAKVVLVVAFAVTAGSYAWALYVTRDPDNYTDRMVLVVGHVAAVASIGTPYYFGIYSGAPALMAIGLFVYALGTPREHATGVYLTVAGAQLGLAVLIISGVVADRGLIRGGHLALHEQIILQVYVAGIYTVTYLVARASRRSTYDAMLNLEIALRELVEREALFQEARHDLARALRIGGPGRYSEQTVGRFVLGNVIGRGGMGEVYEATDRRDGGEAAVKLLHSDAIADSEESARFVREAEVAAAIDSIHVVRVLDASVEGSPRPYLAMERLRGEDLGAILRRERHLPLHEVIELARQIGAGLGAAHAAGVIHRDLKPSNLFRVDGADGPVWKILDFGVSTLVGNSGTLTGQRVVGTPVYMAPEQARGGKVDARTDLYALGAIIYRALTGRPPVAGNDVAAILYGVVHGGPVPATGLVEVPPDVDQVLAVALAKLPADRFASAAEMVDALEAASRGKLDEGLRVRADAVIAKALLPGDEKSAAARAPMARA